ncbi:PTS beta-glucoside transporter subunit IIBCA [Clostridiales bacterium COT073_COT-073]|nr:PTS beta-glucoside transporter subunit IIBCA [Clostridiales bacterium COT073_COT-073]
MSNSIILYYKEFQGNVKKTQNLFKQIFKNIMKTNEMLGIVLGLTLVSGQLLNAYGVASAAAGAIPQWDFGFFQINMIGYQAQIIPAIMAAFTLVYLERFFRKITPEVISMIVVPFCSLLLAVVAAHFVLGPIGWKIGEVVSSVVYSGITGSFKIVFGAIFGFFYAPLVITGLHHMSNAIDLQLIATYEGTMLWPMIALSNIAQGSAVLGMIYMQRKNAVAQEVNIPSTISCYLGVTEPAMFGVNLKYKFPFLAGMIGSALAAIVCVATGTTARSVGIGGLPGILSIKTEYMLSFAICMLIAVVVPFVLTVFLGKQKLSDVDLNGEDIAETEASFDKEMAINPELTVKAEDGQIKAFLSGQVIPLKEVNDGVFSEGMMGDGLAILPDNEILYSPVDAEVTVVMPDSRHACGLKMDNGMELLLHIGLDTVNMKGDGFEYMVAAGQRVKAGEALIHFSKDKIKQAGYPDMTIFVVTNEGNAKNIEFKTGFTAQAADSVIATFKA